MRATIGATNPVEAAPGTVRADFGLDKGRNLRPRERRPGERGAGACALLRTGGARDAGTGMPTGGSLMVAAARPPSRSSAVRVRARAGATSRRRGRPGGCSPRAA
ncbi:hypothetical protein O0235_10795 [Tepidiforma flava]|uniref:Uncharacterized protein n=1 Tax=Tepidiforma flava TaxID=3004094 RepID=A0ABY7M3X6_9CHLR|nr:hypothetical protein O0235_10795 [Tepidiforma flava]